MEVKSATFGSLQNNCYLITDEISGLSALVDCTEYSEKMKNFIGDAKLEYILLTHGHFDHIGGVKEVKEAYGAKVVIGREDAEMLSSSRRSLAAFSFIHQENTTPDIIVDDGDVITIGSTKLKVLHTTGHTPGGVCYVGDGEIFSGDTLFFCSCGRTDFPGGSSSQIMESLKKIAALEGNLTVYPGHDRFSTLDFEREHNPYMKTV